MQSGGQANWGFTKVVMVFLHCHMLAKRFIIASIHTMHYIGDLFYPMSLVLLNNSAIEHGILCRANGG
jgi:hypothetical protein